MKLLDYFIILCAMLLGVQAKTNKPDDDFCGIRNTTTQSGEVIDYTIFYSLAGVYVNAGSVIFSNKLEKLNGKTVYHISGEGGSNSSYDWIYKVRDRYETYIDTATMLPMKFIRAVHEGNHKKFENISFDHTNNTVITNNGIDKVPPCVQDVLSSVYYARNINFQNYKPGDKIPFKMFLDKEVHSLYIHYLGKEVVNTKYGRFKALKFKPLLVEGTIFKGGENMTVWVSDDANHVPVRIESPILIGSIKADLAGYKKLRHPVYKFGKEK